MDFNSEGLLLLTNSGSLSRYLELPKNSFVREYKVKVKGVLDMQKLKKLKKGIIIKGIKYKSINFGVLEKNEKYFWLKMKLIEGKNREIRKICKYFKWSIIKLIRLQFGPVKLQKEKPGQIKELIPIPKSFL